MIDNFPYDSHYFQKKYVSTYISPMKKDEIDTTKSIDSIPDEGPFINGTVRKYQKYPEIVIQQDLNLTNKDQEEQISPLMIFSNQEQISGFLSPSSINNLFTGSNKIRKQDMSLTQRNQINKTINKKINGGNIKVSNYLMSPKMYISQIKSNLKNRKTFYDQSLINIPSHQRYQSEQKYHQYQQQDFNFQPDINKNSKKIAVKQREKSLDDILHQENNQKNQMIDNLMVKFQDIHLEYLNFDQLKDSLQYLKFMPIKISTFYDRLLKEFWNLINYSNALKIRKQILKSVLWALVGIESDQLNKNLNQNQVQQPLSTTDIKFIQQKFSPFYNQYCKQFERIITSKQNKLQKDKLSQQSSKSLFYQKQNQSTESTKTHQKSQSQTNLIKDFNKSIERMRSARNKSNDKTQKKNWNPYFKSEQNPISEFDKNYSYYCKTENRRQKNASIYNNQNQKILSLSINIGKSSPEHITIYENSNIQLIAEQFCQTHNLTSEMYGKLINFIHQNLNSFQNTKIF